MNAVTKIEPKPSLTTGNTVAAIVPTNVDEAYRLAKIIHGSGMAPQSLKTPEQVMVAMMAGAELGMVPFQAVRHIAVVNGRPTLWGDGLVAVARSQGVQIKETLSGDDLTAMATCEVTRPDTGEIIIRTFSATDAKKAGLWGKQGPWQQYPKRMLQMRARAFALRDGAADILNGFQVAEEVQDYSAPREGIVPQIAPAEALRLEASAPAGSIEVEPMEVDQPEAPTEIADAAIEETIAKARDMFPEDEPATERDPNTEDMFPGDK